MDVVVPKLCFKPDVDEYLKKRLSEVQFERDEETDRPFEELKETLGIPPMFTTFRINTLKSDRDSVKARLAELFCQLEFLDVNLVKLWTGKSMNTYGSFVTTIWNQVSRIDWYIKDGYKHHDVVYDANIFFWNWSKENSLEILDHEDLPDVLVIPHKGPRQLEKKDIHVIVGLLCGMSVLRGAHVFAQGIVGAPSHMQAGDSVSVYADVDGKCRKGLIKPFDGRVVFVGNGVAEISRNSLFCSEELPNGIGIRMNDSLYEAPPLNGILPSLVFSQNLPSIVCSHVLNPQPGEHVLDMCAAPGGKTTHIATLMKDKGQVVAFDKSSKKISRIMENASAWSINIISAYSFDGRKSCSQIAGNDGGPPYPPCTFDRILLDAPCSALGQRPVVNNPSHLSEITSFPPLQKKLFSQAVDLLKVDGILVYSTCTFTLEENERLVSWALKTFPCIQLSKQVPHIGTPGRCGSDLPEDQLSLLQCFFPNKHCMSSVNTDTIGFFIAKFVKMKEDNKDGNS